MKEKRVVGVSPWSNPNYTLMKEAGIQWLRITFVYPFKDKLDGEYTEEFLKVMDEVKKLRGMGFRIMGTTPMPGMTEYDEATKSQGIWHRYLPEWTGEIDSDGYYDAYEKGCERIGSLTRGLVDMWQVSNEMDILEFRGAMTKEQAARFMLAGGRGVKKGNPGCKPGINPSGIYTPWGSSDGRWFFKTLYADKDHPFDYAGIDAYFGSWIKGGVEDWILWIDEIYDMAHRPVLINEWGYASLGGLPKPSVVEIRPGINSVCDTGAWHNIWKKEHSVEEQGEYLRTGLKIFATYPNVLGSFLYCWGDSETCWHCGSPTCPAECGWGIVDNTGKPKVSYEVFKKTVHEFY